MKRPQISDQVLTWLGANLLPDDFGQVHEHLFVIRQPGADKPLCLITAATGRYCWSADRPRQERLRAAGCTVYVVRSAKEVQFAIGPKLLLELRARRTAADQPAPRKTFPIIQGSLPEAHPIERAAILQVAA